VDLDTEPESLPSLVLRDIARRPRTLLLVLLSLFAIVLGIARQEIMALAFGGGWLLIVLGYTLVFVAMDVRRKEQERDA
jgi:uncharacterized membrane protein